MKVQIEWVSNVGKKTKFNSNGDDGDEILFNQFPELEMLIDHFSSIQNGLKLNMKMKWEDGGTCRVKIDTKEGK